MARRRSISGKVRKPVVSEPFPCACGRVPQLTTGAEIYPHRPDLFHKRFWICRPCDAYVGCHPNSDRPLGPPADPETRRARRRAHDAVDPIWKRANEFYQETDPAGVEKLKRVARGRVYRWLALQMGIDQNDCHVGHSSPERCARIVELLRGMDYREIRQQLKAVDAQQYGDRTDAP